jgi:hypothetical protein
MEETKYHRKALAIGSHAPSIEIPSVNDDTIHKSDADLEMKANPVKPTAVISQGDIKPQPEMSYWAKLRLIRQEDLRENTPLTGMSLRPFIYFRFPVIVFSGFMYGAVICYFNVLNGTVSLILSAPPYSFPPSIVGLSYTSCLIGVFLG